ncbi:hypothetical protein [Streptomyces inhibens]|uniref:hypothetical protein n=1 Tax=Streptomyces inhibens TaxID=2293571 RepID=UPI001FD29EF5|nr:hypothetical protein [Streptomyces inhibens]
MSASTTTNAQGDDDILTSDPSTPAARILEIDGYANVPATLGRLNLNSITIRGGSAVAPYPGDGDYNNSGTVNLLAGNVSGNTPNNTAPPRSVPGCTGDTG